MYCKNCGQEIPDGAAFCGNCGTEVRRAPGGEQEPSAAEEKGRRRWNPLKIGAVMAALVLILAVAGGVGYSMIGLAKKQERLAKEIEQSEIQEYVEQKDKIDRQWKGMGVLDISGKKRLLEQLEDLRGEIGQFEEYQEEVRALEEEKEKYKLDEDSYSAYEEILAQCQEAVEQKQASEAGKLLQKTREALEEVIEENDAYVTERMELYQSQDLSEAEAEVKSGYEKQMKVLEELADTRETAGYAEFPEAFAEMDQVIYLYLEPEQELDVEVQQVDASEFPKVKLYLRVEDPDTGEVPEGLESSYFYLTKEDFNARYVKQVIEDVYQLNEQEALKIDMVADVSGSMAGAPLVDAQEVMSNFVNSVQFDAGDLVELISFSTGVRLEEEFTDDATALNQKIENLYTGDMTSLFDALYTAVGRAAAQTGARCVIAFTDGADNYSSCSAEDVIELANRYHIPVFMIGIGDMEDSAIASIAEQTGGNYYRIEEISSMQSIYDEIYRMEKELYLLSFTEHSDVKLTDMANIRVGYKSVEYGGESGYSYTPNTLVSVDADALYLDGPEAVVENYMKNFDDAMTHMDFSYIEEYLLPGSGIYQTQQAYVQRGIAEQLDSYEIVSTDYQDSENCIVSTRETYYVRVPNKPLQLMTQQCQYAVTKSGGEWKMRDFVGDIHVLSRINQ